MAYGTVKTDTIIFDQGGADQNATVSGIYRAITSGVTVSGTIAGAVLIGTTTVSGTTVTGTTANFASGVFTTQVSGATVTGTQSSFTSGNFVTLSGATATFTSGVIASGTAAAPSLSIISDPNTGIYSPGADTLAFVEGGVEAMRIDSNGRVGIGNNAPSFELDLGKDSAVQNYTQRIITGGSYSAASRYDLNGIGTFTVGFNNSGGIVNNAPNGAASLWMQQAYPIVFGTNGTERARIDSSGSVGIGTTSPGCKIDIVSENNTSLDPVLRIYSNNLAVNTAIAYDGITGSSQFQLRTSSSNPLLFGTNNTERARIDSSGNVGIGTSSPSSQLHCTGDIKFGDAITLSRNISTGLVTIADATTEPYTQGFALRTYETDEAYRFQNGDGTSTYFTIRGSGNVGIGTTSPAYKLDVAGEIRSTGGINALRLENSSNAAVYAVFTRPNQQYTLAINSDNDGARTFDLYDNTNAHFVDQYLQGASGYRRFFTNGTERARIDSSGRLLVGTSSGRNNAKMVVEGYPGGNSSVFDLRYAGTSVGSDDIGIIRFSDQRTDTGNQVYASISAQLDGTSSSVSDLPGRLILSTTADGASIPTERMRIDSAGALKASTNSTYKFGTGIGEITHNDATSTVHLTASSTGFTGDAVTISTYRNTVNDSYKFLSCIRQGFAFALEIRDDGDVYNVNGTYGSLSDVKLKENIVDANSQWDDIRQLRVRNYNFKPETNNSTHKQIGVIAQEIEDISPGLVNTVPDRDEDGNDLGTVTKSVNYSVLYMKAVKALQEAMERIETLEARLTAAGIE